MGNKNTSIYLSSSPCTLHPPLIILALPVLIKEVCVCSSIYQQERQRRDCPKNKKIPTRLYINTEVSVGHIPSPNRKLSLRHVTVSY